MQTRNMSISLQPSTPALLGPPFLMQPGAAQSNGRTEAAVFMQNEHTVHAQLAHLFFQACPGACCAPLDELLVLLLLPPG